MQRLAENSWRLAILILLAASAARGQAQSGIWGDSAAAARSFEPIRAMQGAKSATQTGAAATSSVASGQDAPATKPAKRMAHRFWDTQNILLFAGVGAARGLDYASTLNMRRRGVNEVLLNNETVDNHAEFAVIEAATAAASIGLSAIWHYTGHHKLERWTSYIHIGVTVAGAGRNYALKTQHAGT